MGYVTDPYAFPKASTAPEPPRPPKRNLKTVKNTNRLYD